MVKLHIIRDTFNEKETLGRLFVDNAHVCETLELPWRDNQRNISCIPKGTYQVVERTSPKFKDHLHVLKVPGRSYILIHAGNTHNDIRGCILPGVKRGKLGAENAVLGSRTAMREILQYCKGQKIELTIE